MSGKLIVKVVFAVAALALLIVLCLPTLLFSAPVKSWLLNDLLPAHGVEAEIDELSVGWFSPTRLRSVAVGPADRRRLVLADEISVNRTLLQALFSGRDLGQLTIRHPRVHVWMDEASSNLKFEKLEESLDDLDVGSASQSEAGSTEIESASGEAANAKTFVIQVEDAELHVKTPNMQEETNVFRNLNLRCTIQDEGVRRTLLIDPGPIIKRASITPEMCEAGLKFVVPILANATWTQGEFSLDLDACVIDLDEPKNSLISGRLTIHGIEAGIKNELADSIADSVSTLLGGNGFDSVHLADDSVVQFQVREQMVWHEGVEFGLPRVSEDLVVRTSGSVSFDENLDLTIECPMPLHLIANGPVSRALREQNLALQAVGTLQQPKVKLKDGDFVTNLLNGISGELAEEEQPIRSVLQGIRDAVRGEPNDDASIEDAASRAPILDRLRNRIRERRQSGENWYELESP